MNGRDRQSQVRVVVAAQPVWKRRSTARRRDELRQRARAHPFELRAPGTAREVHGEQEILLSLKKRRQQQPPLAHQRRVRVHPVDFRHQLPRSTAFERRADRSRDPVGDVQLGMEHRGGHDWLDATRRLMGSHQQAGGVLHVNPGHLPQRIDGAAELAVAVHRDDFEIGGWRDLGWRARMFDCGKQQRGRDDVPHAAYSTPAPVHAQRVVSGARADRNASGLRNRQAADGIHASTPAPEGHDQCGDRRKDQQLASERDEVPGPELRQPIPSRNRHEDVR